MKCTTTFKPIGLFLALWVAWIISPQLMRAEAQEVDEPSHQVQLVLNNEKSSLGSKAAETLNEIPETAYDVSIHVFHENYLGNLSLLIIGVDSNNSFG